MNGKRSKRRFRSGSGLAPWVCSATAWVVAWVSSVTPELSLPPASTKMLSSENLNVTNKLRPLGNLHLHWLRHDGEECHQLPRPAVWARNSDRVRRWRP